MERLQSVTDLADSLTLPWSCRAMELPCHSIIFLTTTFKFKPVTFFLLHHWSGIVSCAHATHSS